MPDDCQEGRPRSTRPHACPQNKLSYPQGGVSRLAAPGGSEQGEVLMLRKTICATVFVGIGGTALLMFSQAQALPLGPALAPLAEKTSSVLPVYYYHGHYYRYRYHHRYYNHRYYRYY